MSNEALANIPSTPQGEIPKELELQWKQIERLNSVLDDLDSKLSPILAPEDDSNAQVVPAVGKSMLTMHGQTIADHTDQLFRMANAIATIIVRLEV